MNKTQFTDLVNYIKNRPAEARRLFDVLSASANESQPIHTTIRERQEDSGPAEEWLTARQVGSKIGRSSRWVREHIDLLPTSCVSRDEVTNTWLFSWTMVDVLRRMKFQRIINQKTEKE